MMSWCYGQIRPMRAVHHTTYAIDATGQIDRTSGQLPAAVATSLAPARVTVRDGTGCRLAARLLRQLASRLERGGGDSP